MLVPNVSQAQRRGGRGWGGRDGGWGNSGYYGDGWGWGGRSWGYPGNYGYDRGGFGYYGYNNGWYSPGYNYSYTPDSGYSSDLYSQPGYYQGGDTYQYGMTQSNQGYDQNAAILSVRIPPDAQLSVEGQATQQRGMFRQFVSPPLTPNREFTYDIKATWNQNGREVTQTRHVPVRAGQQVRVDFMQPQAQQGQMQYGAQPGATGTEQFNEAQPGVQDLNESNRRGSDRNQRGTDLDESHRNQPGRTNNLNTNPADTGRTTTNPADRNINPPRTNIKPPNPDNLPKPPTP
jgi:uncharacterized protein (TIGR03000 family)